MLLGTLIRCLFKRTKPSSHVPAAPVRFRPQLEPLEDRRLLATFRVLNLNDAGFGSFRQALLDSNSNLGADVIKFRVAGTVRLTSGALPGVTDAVTIDGTTAPRFQGTPAVEIDANGFDGLRFDAGSAGSVLKSLGFVNAAGAGITLNAGNIRLFGNFIGVLRDGRTAAGNRGNGVTINASSSGNVIGSRREGERNLISGNGGHGIAIDGSAGNQIQSNFIGTDTQGTHALGNGGNGILLTNGATANVLGGVIPPNPPGTKPVDFSGEKPPQGNLISGNGANGVLLTRGASGNRLHGNFIGTTINGTKALGNGLDGVAITDGSNSNLLSGTIQKLDPFIFYNVISGNHGNGLRVHDSDNTTIQANFFGLGSNNRTPVGNGLNGVVIEGSSSTITFGGVIPLGNVVAANRLNGIVVKDTASGFLSFNTFAGVAAFTENPFLGNGQDGMLITSTGGRNLIRTNVISRNGDDGIEISGEARDVQVVQNEIGVNTGGSNALPNQGNGVEISGNAHDNVIGGPQPTFSIIRRNLISGNLGYGVAVLENAHNNHVNFSYIGLDRRGTTPIGNALGGVLLGPGTRSTTIGSPLPALLTAISGNRGNGVEMVGTTGNTVVGTRIGTNRSGDPLPNRGNGILIANSSSNVIGDTTPGGGNRIAFNLLNGVVVESGERNSIRQNSIHENGSLGIALAPGANRNQTAPTLAAVVRGPDGVIVSGVLLSRPSTTFVVELFADRKQDRSGFGEGRLFLGSVVVTTNAAGLAPFTFVGKLPRSFRFLAATATDSLGNTSEFSRSKTV